MCSIYGPFSFSTRQPLNDSNGTFWSASIPDRDFVVDRAKLHIQIHSSPFCSSLDNDFIQKVVLNSLISTIRLEKYPKAEFRYSFFFLSNQGGAHLAAVLAASMSTMLAGIETLDFLVASSVAAPNLVDPLTSEQLQTPSLFLARHVHSGKIVYFHSEGQITFFDDQNQNTSDSDNSTTTKLSSDFDNLMTLSQKCASQYHATLSKTLEDHFQNAPGSSRFRSTFRITGKSGSKKSKSKS